MIFEEKKNEKEKKKNLICPLCERCLNWFFSEYSSAPRKMKEKNKKQNIGWPKMISCKFIFRVQKYLQDRDREHLGRFWVFLTETHKKFFFFLFDEFFTFNHAWLRFFRFYHTFRFALRSFTCYEDFKVVQSFKALRNEL